MNAADLPAKFHGQLAKELYPADNPMFQHHRFDLQSRAPGARKWDDTPHSTSVWAFVPQLLDAQIKLHPELQWRIVGEVVTCHENGQPITANESPKHPAA